MSYAYTTYSETSGSCSVFADGAGGYNTWGKISASCYTKGSTLYVTMTASTSNSPYLRACFAVNGATVYDSGYIKNNSKLWPRGNGTTYSTSFSLPNATSNPTIQTGIGVSTSSVTWGKVVTLTRTATKYAYWDINAYNPAGVQDYKAAKFDEYIGNTKVATQVTNESANHIYQPYGTWGYVGNIQPYYNYYELDHVADNGGVLSPNANGLYGSYLNGNEDDILIYMRYKHSWVTLNANGGVFSDETTLKGLDPPVVYSKGSWTNVPVPTRTGYKFLGYFDSEYTGATKVYDEKGIYVPNTSYWGTNGFCKIVNNSTFYAQWEIQNVCYVKQDNKWKLSTVHVKTENGWKPAIMYVKTANGWKQSGP